MCGYSGFGGVSVYIRECYLSNKIETLYVCVLNSVIELCSVDVVVGGENCYLESIDHIVKRQKLSRFSLKKYPKALRFVIKIASYLET